MNRAHSIYLVPTPTQEEFLNKSCGCARFVYNWGLARWKELYASGKKPTYYSLKKEFNHIKREQFPWVMEVSKWGVEQSFANLGKAFKKFFDRQNSYPKFHRKFVHESFCIDGSVIRLHDKRIKLPKIGWIKMRESLRFQEARLISATISKRAGRWFISLSCEIPDPPKPVRENQAVGIDLGIKELAVLSNGERYEGPKALKRLLPRVRRLSRAVYKKQKGSNRRARAVQKLSRMEYRVSCIRGDYLHKLTADITERFTHIAIEDLDVKGMVENKLLARHISDQAFAELRRQLQYKSEVLGGKVHVIDRFFPSSKTCSECGHIYKDLKLSDRVWVCPGCGKKHNRDHNASINILNAAGFAV